MQNQIEKKIIKRMTDLWKHESAAKQSELNSAVAIFQHRLKMIEKFVNTQPKQTRDYYISPYTVVADHDRMHYKIVKHTDDITNYISTIWIKNIKSYE